MKYSMKNAFAGDCSVNGYSVNDCSVNNPPVNDSSVRGDSPKRQYLARFIAASAVMLTLICSQAALATAASINSLKLMSDGASQSLSIAMDAPAEYQVFNLQGPDRLVLSFPGATLSDKVVQLSGVGGIENIVPRQDKNGVRLEIGLLKGRSCLGFER